MRHAVRSAYQRYYTQQRLFISAHATFRVDSIVRHYAVTLRRHCQLAADATAIALRFITPPPLSATPCRHGRCRHFRQRRL